MPKIQQHVDFQISVPDRPGELFRITKALQDAEINLRAMWGFGIGGGHAEIIVVPEDPDQFRTHAEDLELEFEERTVFHFTGRDELGALVETIEKIAAAGINVHSFDAIALGGKFGAYCWVADEDRERLNKVLGP
jgi:hypothetical protein